MPYKDKETRQAYINKWRRESRRKRGLQKQGRKPLAEDQKLISLDARKNYGKEWIRKHNMEKPAIRLYRAAKRRAKDGGLEFNLEKSDIIVPTHCPILGIPLVSTRQRGDSRRDIASLDRVDSSRGYTKDNIEVISWLANTMKSDATPELLVKFSKTMLARYGTDV